MIDLNKITAYELEEKRDLPEQKATGYRLRHKKTKARVLLIENEDTNKVFNIGFRTPPSNSKGIQHIIEHTVLCGSTKFPSKDPFVELAKGSLNTFLNAMTYSDKTVYPVASVNAKDFHNLLDVYLDAVFNPNIYKDERIFKQEGWHYEIESPESELIYNGVVYNEMKGAYSSVDAVLANAVNEALYPDTVYSNDSGGDPDIIPQLGREEYLDYHRDYYHPSNSYIYLYGNVDFEKELNYIDSEYLSNYDYKFIDSEIKDQAAFDKPVYKEVEYSLSEDEELEGNTHLSYNVVVGRSTDKLLVTAINILQGVLFEVPGAPVKKALIDAGICADVESAFDSTMRQPAFTIIARHTDPENEETFIKIVEDTMKKIADEGINPRSLEAALNKLEFINKEASSGRFPKGLTLGLDSFEAWLHDDELAMELFTYQPVFDELRKKISEGYFEQLIRDAFLNNSHKAFVKVVPVKGLNRKHDEALKSKLREIKAGLTDEQISQLIEETAALKKFQAEPSTPEELEKIPLLEIDDIDKQAYKLKNKIEKVDGVTVVHSDIFTNGITYLNLAFSIHDFDYDDLPYISLITDVLKYVDTEKHSYNDLADEINLKTGGIGFNTTLKLCDDGKSYQDYFTISMKVFDEKLPEGFELIKELITSSKLKDKKRLKEILAEILSLLKNTIVDSGHSIAAMRALSYIFKGMAEKEYLDGQEYLRFIDASNKNFDAEVEKIGDKLEEVLRKILRKKALIINYTSNRELSEIRDVFSDFISILSDDDIRPESEVKTVEPVMKNEGFKAASKVQYVATAADYKSAGLDYTGALDVLRIIFSYEYLWVNVRVVGGAYGAMCDFSRSGSMSLVSYRDPNLMETYEIYKKAADYVKTFDASDRDMTKYIIGAIAKLDMPLSPSQEGLYNFSAYLMGIDDEDIQLRRDQVLACNCETIRSLEPYVRLLSDSKIICALGNEEKLEAAREHFGSVESIV